MKQTFFSAQFKRILAAVAAALILMTAFPTASLAATKYVVNCNNLNVRKSDSTKSAVITMLPKGTTVNVTGTKGDWAKITFDGKVGYVAKSYLAKPSAKTAVQTTSKSASSNSSGYKTLSTGSSGAAVKKLQARLQQLGYLTEAQVTGKYTNSTVKAVKYFQMQTGADLTGKATPALQTKLYSKSAPKKKPIVTMDWFSSNINRLFAKHSTAYIIDCATGTRIRIRRLYGTNHADVEPAAASDTAKLKAIYGGSWSWNSRAVILVVGGKYVAAAINGMPHGDQISKTNNFDGQFCLHTTSSKTHGSNKVHSGHQASIRTAARFLG